MELTIVRHGEARHNLGDGQVFVSNPAYAEIEKTDENLLSPAGELQARLTGRALSDVDFDAVLVSPIARAVQTAAGIVSFQKKHKTIEIFHDIKEIDCGGYPIPPIELYRAFWDSVVLSPDSIDCGDRLPFEADEDWQPRAMKVKNYLLDRFRGDERVLIVTHAGFIFHGLGAALMGVPEDRLDDYRVGADNCSITRIFYNFEGKGRIGIGTVNSSAHLK